MGIGFPEALERPGRPNMRSLYVGKTFPEVPKLPGRPNMRSLYVGKTFPEVPKLPGRSKYAFALRVPNRVLTASEFLC
jgi:hypothetical protein